MRVIIIDNILLSIRLHGGGQEELGEMTCSVLACSYVGDTVRCNHCHMCVVYSTLPLYIVDKLKFLFETSSLSRFLEVQKIC